MTRYAVEAIYENGVLKLDQPLPLEDHARVQITVRAGPSRAEQSYGLLRWKDDPKVLEEIALSPDFGIEESP